MFFRQNSTHIYPDEQKARFSRTQDELIDHINSYLNEKNKSLLAELKNKYSSRKYWFTRYSRLRKRPLQHGFCNGITLLWIKKMFQRDEVAFYAMRDKIIESDPKDLSDDASQVDTFITYLKVGQHPARYNKAFTQRTCSPFFGIHCASNINETLSNEKLITRFKEIFRNDAYLMLSAVQSTHVIGIVKRDDTIYFFDANADEDEALTIANEEILVEKIIQGLFTEINIPIPDSIEYQFDVFRNPPRKRTFYDSITDFFQAKEEKSTPEDEPRDDKEQLTSALMRYSNTRPGA